MKKKKTAAKAKSKPKKRKATENTPLMTASFKGDLAKVKKLLAEGADPNERSTSPDVEHEFLGATFTTIDSGRTAIMLAAYAGKPRIVEKLLAAGAIADDVDDEGKTVLCHAADSDASRDDVVAVIELLLAAGAKVNREAGFTPLQCAAERNDPALVKSLLDLGADPNGRIWTEGTALMTAARKGNVESVSLLLEAGADPNLRDRDGSTALHDAAEANRTPDVTLVLLRAGADVTLTNRDGKTPLRIVAGRYGGIDGIVDALLEAGARPDAKDLCAAASMNQLATVVRFLDTGVDLESRDDKGKTPLTLVAENGYVDLAVELLARGAKVEEEARALAKQNERNEILRVFAGEDVPSPGLPPAYFAASQKAQEHAAAGRWKEALEIYLTIPATLRQRTSEIASNLGYAYQQLGRHAEAVVAFEEAIKRRPDRAHVPKAACYSYCELQRWNEMEIVALKAAELAPSDDYVWQQVAIARQQKDDLAGAIEAGERALELNPKNGYAAYNLGRDLWKAKKTGWKEAFATSFETAPTLREHAKTDEDLDGLRGDAEFQALLAPR